MTGGVSLDVSVETTGAARAGALDLCDRLLGEIGRREHRFAWLRTPGSDGQEWLAVDAYYPGNRVVICCSADPEARALCAQLVPANGLHLVTIVPTELGGDFQATALGIRERLERSGWSPRPTPTATPAPVMAAAAPAPSPTPRSGVPARRTTSAAASAAAATATRTPRSTEYDQRFGVAIGLALSAIVLLEAFLGVVVVGAEHGHLLLGLGIVLDAGARVIGTMTAGHDGDHETAWAALIVGSPVVVSFNRPEASETAKVAGVVATVALSVATLGAVLAVL
jgi:hypothetical protein